MGQQQPASSLYLAYRWFCRLSIEDTVPEHSKFSKNRHGRFRDADAFRFVIEQVLERCITEGLVGGEGFAIDASIIKADVSRRRHHEGGDDDWSGGHAVEEYLNSLDRSIPEGGKAPMKVSQTDPASRWTAANEQESGISRSTIYETRNDDNIASLNVELFNSIRLEAAVELLRLPP